MAIELSELIERRGPKMAEQLCPICGCTIGDEAYEEEGVIYCCEACAIGWQCECGCCVIVEEQEQ